MEKGAKASRFAKRGERRWVGEDQRKIPISKKKRLAGVKRGR